jgi:DNA-binding transcriptional LysR family regulator
MLDVRRLNVLREVVQRGSFSAAADSLHLSQSAVSQQVANLEREVGLKLLERTSDGPKLTPAGETVVSHADAVINRLAEAERELTEIAGLEGGRLRLMSFPTASANLVTRAMSRFHRVHPEVELRFSEGEPEDSIPALKRGDLDLAVVFDYDGVPEDFGRDTDATMIFQEQMRVALAPGHPLAASETVELRDLADDEWLCGEGPSSCRALVVEACRKAGFEPKPSFESDDYEVLKGLVAAGLGVTLLPELAGGHPGIALKDVFPDPPLRRIWAVTREKASRSPASEAMLSLLREVGERFPAERDLRSVA